MQWVEHTMYHCIIKEISGSIMKQVQSDKLNGHIVPGENVIYYCICHNRIKSFTFSVGSLRSHVSIMKGKLLFLSFCLHYSDINIIHFFICMYIYIIQIYLRRDFVVKTNI
jgi:hypothetical protein